MTQEGAVASGKRTRVLVAAGIGNFIEWYDFLIFGFLATIISPLFFPSDDPVASLLATFAVFGVGFGMRPIGALFFGHVGDRIGRRDTLMLVLTLMAVGTVILGLAPTYEQAGVLGPIVLVFARALQGFSVGGEFAGGSSFMVEYAPADKRGFFGSWQMFGQMGGVFAGALVGFLLTLSLSDEALSSWGWRIAFLVAVPLIFVALYMRLRLEETPHFKAVEAADRIERAPLLASLRKHYRALLIMMGIVALPGIGTYVLFVSTPSYLATTQDRPASHGLAATIIAIAVFLAAIPILGMITDRVGRKPVLIAGAAGMILLATPLYLLIAQDSFVLIVLALSVGGLLVAAPSVVMPTVLVEVVPTQVRYSSISLGYGIATAVFSGTAPYIATYLVDRTGNALSPSFYLIAAAAITLIASLAVRETFSTPLRD